MKYDYMIEALKEFPNTMNQAICDAKITLEENEELQIHSDKLFSAELKLLKFFEDKPEGLELFKEYKECFEKHAGESCEEMYIQGLFDHHRVYTKHMLISSKIFKTLYEQEEI